MGLTIHYRFAFKGTETDLKSRLHSLRDSYLKLPVAGVGEVAHISRARVESGYGAFSQERILENQLGFMMLYGGYFKHDAAARAILDLMRTEKHAHTKTWTPSQQKKYQSLEHRLRAENERQLKLVQASGNGLCLDVDVGEGCESFRIMLGRLGNGKVWRGQGFTKTQYAAHFVDSHLTVISMLDRSREVGILESVRDEGRYWETRSLDELAKNINRSTSVLKDVIAKFRAEGELKGFEASAPIDQSANYMRVKPAENKEEPEQPESET